MQGPVSHGLHRPGLSGSVEGLLGNSSVSQRISAACPGGLIHCGFAPAPCQGWRPRRKGGEEWREVADVSPALKPPG